MLEMLHLKNVGPAPEMKLEFAPRLNVITGDNGLGKSFILDCVWQMLTAREATRIFPRDIDKEAEIKATVPTSTQKVQLKSKFSRTQQIWENSKDHSYLDFTIVVYQNIENYFFIHDIFSESLRIDLQTAKDIEKFFQFTPNQVWNGEISQKPRINGLIRDIRVWQLKKNSEIEILHRVMKALSPDIAFPLQFGQSWDLDLSDVREIPTIVINESQVPITQASSAIKRILMLAYMLVWTYLEHLRVAKAAGFPPSREIILLVDEIEQHLHPKWQRSIVSALIEAVKAVVSIDVQVQIITTTHSPLVMASLEPLFDPKKDAWFDLNLVGGQVTLEKMNFVKHGGAEMWLLSDAFDLQSTGSKQRELAIEEAARAIENPKLGKKKFLEIDKKLRGLLSDTDEYWLNWRFYGERKGWL